MGGHPRDVHTRGEGLTVRISVDSDKCTGHALCRAAGPNVYVLDELGFNVTPAGEVPPGLEDEAVRGALSCPESAITVED